MTSRRSPARLELTVSRSPRSRSRMCGVVLLAALAAGCGGQSSSTDTGNPPVVLGDKLRLTAAESGVLVSGASGVVAGGARVDVVDRATGQTATTTANADGSFEIAVGGSITDEYRVYSTTGGQNWRTILTSSGAATPEVGLAGLDFLLESARGYTPVAGTTMRLSFRESELSFSAGCNGHFGSYSLCGRKLCVSQLGSTEMGCDPALNAQDTWLSSFFLATPGLTQAGAALTLEGTDATLEFLDREVANPDRPLAGRTWAIDTLISNGAASNVPSPTTPTLQFGADGSLSVFTTCNTGTGSYTRSSQTLALSAVAYTEGACGTGGNATIQAGIQSVIQAGEVTFEIEATRLTIMRGTLGLAAITE
jgi:heat shock protein HslJ